MRKYFFIIIIIQIINIYSNKNLIGELAKDVKLEIFEYVIADTDPFKVREKLHELAKVNRDFWDVAISTINSRQWREKIKYFIGQNAWVTDELLTLNPSKPYSVLRILRSEGFVNEGFLIENKESRVWDLKKVPRLSACSCDRVNEFLEKSNKHKILIVQDNSNIAEYQNYIKTCADGKYHLVMVWARITSTIFFTACTFIEWKYSTPAEPFSLAKVLIGSTFSEIAHSCFIKVTSRFDPSNYDASISKKENIFKAFCHRTFLLKSSSKEILSFPHDFNLPLIPEDVENGGKFLRQDKAKLEMALKIKPTKTNSFLFNFWYFMSSYLKRFWFLSGYTKIKTF